MIILDNVLSPSYVNAIEYEAHQQRYMYAVQTSSKNIGYNGPVLDTDNTYDCGQLECTLFHHSLMQTPAEFFSQLKPLVFTIQDIMGDKMQLDSMIRCKMNILWQKESFPENHWNVVHQDSDIESVSILYYVNESDGDTFLFNEFYEKDKLPNLTLAMRVSPQKNRVVLLDGGRYHAGSNPRHNRERIVINFVFKGKLNGM